MESKNMVLAALFKEAANRGISQERLREEIAPGVIGKRLSAANAVEAARVYAHVSGKKFIFNECRRGGGTSSKGTMHRTPTKYASSLEGFKEEIQALARERYGEVAWETRLNNLCKAHGVRHWRWMRVENCTVIKQTLLRYREQGPYQG